MARLLAMLVTTLLTATAGSGAQAAWDLGPDPLEPLNRVVFDLNQAVDRSVLKPLAEAWRDRLPAGVRRGVRNALANLDEPVSGVNHLLQAQPGRAWVALERFGINSTLGVLGAYDVAAERGLPRRRADFGQTLAVWGIGEGPYLCLPLLGPSTLRDAAGLTLRVLANPLVWIPDPFGTGLAATQYGAETLVARSDGLAFDGLAADSFDAYASVRSAWLQHRQHEIEQARTGDQPWPKPRPGR